MGLGIRNEGFASLTPEWETLTTSSVSDTVFATPTWLAAWWSSCASTEELHLLSVRDGDDLLGVAPFMRSSKTILFVGRSDTCDHHDVTIAKGREEEVLRSLADHLESLEWQQLQLEGLTAESPTLTHLPPLVAEKGWSVDKSFDEVSPSTSLGSSWDEYLGGLKKKDRHEIRRKLRRLMSSGEVRIYDAASESDLKSTMTLFLDLARKSHEEKAEFLNPDRERFFFHLADAMKAQGQLKLFFLELDGTTVAASLCFDYGGAYYLYNSGYEPRFASLSVGLMLKALALKDAIEVGRHTFHFLRGAEPYKFDLGGGNNNLMKLTITR